MGLTEISPAAAPRTASEAGQGVGHRLRGRGGSEDDVRPALPVEKRLGERCALLGDEPLGAEILSLVLLVRAAGEDGYTGAHRLRVEHTQVPQAPEPDHGDPVARLEAGISQAV